ncbi:MAG: nucleotidyltransferase domain-containing protein [Patescibacteria group bacterium]|jgi:hypothetical protein
MDIQKLREFSRQTKEVAERLIKETKVEKVLANLGEFFIGGSYALDLMYGSDIDIGVECPDPRQASLAALKQFIDQRNFQKYEYGDFVAHPRENRPRGYIVNLRREFEARKWEFEIWFLDTSLQIDKDFIAKIKSQLTPEARDKILLRKHQREEDQISKHKLPSIKIYEEVLSGK